MVNQGDYSLRHDVDRLQNKVNVFENEFSDSYFIEASVPAVFYKSDTFYPSSITFYSYQDSKGKTSTYKGTLKVYSSIDGSTYNLIKTSTDSNITIQVTDTDIKFYKCELYNTDDELYDTQTVPLLKDGVEGKDGSSPISIFLGNEAQLIPCTSEGLVQETISFTIPFYCYKGTAMYTCNYAVGSTNYWTQQGFTYQLDKQCSTTDNGQLTITAPKDSSLRGLKHSNITMDFVVDGETISKEFNWAKVIKGEDGVDGVDGDDGKPQNCYIRYSETDDPQDLSYTSEIEVTGWKYQGIAWTTDTTAPTNIDAYKPFVLYKATDGVKGADGYVHTAYCKDITTYAGFNTGEPDVNSVYLGIYTDNTKSDPEEPELYEWTKIKGENGADGTTPSPDTIKQIVQDTEINATTLNGNTEDSFIPSALPTEIVYRNNSETTKNYVKLYQIGQIIICQVCNFKDDGTNYGQDPDSSSYFLLMDKTIPAKWLPSEPLYINDLNTATGESNGRLRLSTRGYVTKLGTAGSSYNNTYGTFIYPIVPRADTTIDYGVSETTIEYGSRIEATVTSNGSNVSGVPITFKFTNSNGATVYETVAYSTSSGKAVATINAPVGTNYTLTVQCKGNGSYNPSNIETVSGITVSQAKTQFSMSQSGTTITCEVLNSKRYALINATVNFYGQIGYTDSSGRCTFTVSTDGTYTASVPLSTNYTGASATITVSGLTPKVVTVSERKVPNNAYNTGVTSAAKAWANTSEISKVQVQENTASEGYAMYVAINGSGWGLNVQPAPICFNKFGFSNQGTVTNIHVKVMYGVFCSVTGGSMEKPDVYLMKGSTTYGGVQAKDYSTTTIDSANIYYPAEFDITASTIKDKGITVSDIMSDDLMVKVDAKRNSYTTSSSYNKATFKIDYVEVTATFNKS